MKIPKNTILTAAALVFLVAASFPALSFARGLDDTNPNRVQALDRMSDSARDRFEAAQLRIHEDRHGFNTHLGDGKLRSCHNREDAINRIMARISDRGTRHLELFTKIADRVKAFYVDKALTADNYDELVAAMDAKKADAQAAVDALKSSSADFKCDGTDPKGAALVFKDLMKDEIKALKDYRTSVKDLIVAIKSSKNQGQDTQTEQGGTE